MVVDNTPTIKQDKQQVFPAIQLELDSSKQNVEKQQIIEHTNTKETKVAKIGVTLEPPTAQKLD